MPSGQPGFDDVAIESRLHVPSVDAGNPGVAGASGIPGVSGASGIAPGVVRGSAGWSTAGVCSCRSDRPDPAARGTNGVLRDGRGWYGSLWGGTGSYGWFWFGSCDHIGTNGSSWFPDEVRGGWPCMAVSGTYSWRLDSSILAAVRGFWTV
jgi:hypothetical protein